MSSGTFSSKDLALLLPDEVGDSFTMQHTVDKTSLQEEDVVEFQPKIDTSKKVMRLRAGKAPIAGAVSEYDGDIYHDDDDDDENAFNFSSGKKNQNNNIANVELENISQTKKRPSRWDSVVSKERIETSVENKKDISNNENDDDEEEELIVVSSNRRRQQNAVVLEDDEEDDDFVEGDVPIQKNEIAQEQEDDEEEDEEEIAARRARIRARLRQRQEEEEEEEEEQEEEVERKLQLHSRGRGRHEAVDDVEEEEEEEVEDSSEYETDTDQSEDEPNSKLMKPVFVTKSKRVTIAEQEEKAKKDAQRKKEKEAALEARKEETRQMVAEQIRREEVEAESTANQNGNDSDPANMPDDSDDEDDEVEYLAWKMRELSRLQRDNKLRKNFEAEKAETERRRGLSEEERMAEDRALGKFDEKVKEKRNFMQKYYHKGAFYMDESELAEDDVRKKSYQEATLEDKFDKASMPKILQVKKFGFAGRTKYTHLKDQDTTDYGSAWMQDVGKRKKFDEKLAGVGDIDTAGRKRAK